MRGPALLAMMLLAGCPDPGGGDGGTTEATDAGAEATESTGPVCVDDGFEPNPNQNEATAVLTPFQGDAVLCPNDVDYFEFEAAAPGWVVVFVRQNPDAGTLQLTLRNPAGGPLYSAFTTSRLIPIHRRIPAAGTYAVQVGSAGAAEIGYDLNIQFYPEDI